MGGGLPGTPAAAAAGAGVAAAKPSEARTGARAQGACSAIAQGLLTAQPLERAHALLKQKWARAFQGSQQQQQAGAAPTQAASAAGDPDSGDAHDERIKARPACRTSLPLCNGVPALGLSKHAQPCAGIVQAAFSAICFLAAGSLPRWACTTSWEPIGTDTYL